MIILVCKHECRDLRYMYKERIKQLTNLGWTKWRLNLRYAVRTCVLAIEAMLSYDTLLKNKNATERSVLCSIVYRKVTCKILCK